MELTQEVREAVERYADPTLRTTFNVYTLKNDENHLVLEDLDGLDQPCYLLPRRLLEDVEKEGIATA